MKTDRELLELAAKAAGIVLAHGRDVTDIHPSSVHYLSAPLWSPLEDDGDALRLAIDLQLELLITDHGANACREDVLLAFESRRSCIHSATRRAIVRAAAAIGESMRD